MGTWCRSCRNDATTKPSIRAALDGAFSGAWAKEPIPITCVSGFVSKPGALVGVCVRILGSPVLLQM